MILNALLNRAPVDLAREVDRLFESMSPAPALAAVPAVRAWTHPAINLWEDEHHLHAEAELPGLTMQDIEVLVTADQLTLKGTREIQAPQDARALRRERFAGSFERTVSLPVPIDAERVEARLANGVLTVTLPKSARRLPRKVEVRTPSEAK